jgi:hypothetical protein
MRRSTTGGLARVARMRSDSSSTGIGFRGLMSVAATDRRRVSVYPSRAVRARAVNCSGSEGIRVV